MARKASGEMEMPKRFPKVGKLFQNWRDENYVSIKNIANIAAAYTVLPHITLSILSLESSSKFHRIVCTLLKMISEA